MGSKKELIGEQARFWMLTAVSSSFRALKNNSAFETSQAFTAAPFLITDLYPEAALEQRPPGFRTRSPSSWAQE